ncbi:MAG: glycosyltransferase family 2 protein [Flavobacteriia bacterium]|nr:glycosyltransferase family 2 protein [Flavobacteriia bacterium]
MSTQISVLIPCLNCSSFLQASLRSVREQSLPPMEVLLVDDGSSDDSAQRAKELMDGASFPMHIIRQENRGLGAARNAGIQQVRGEWIALLDADDIWSADKLERMHEVLKGGDMDVVHHSMRAQGGGWNRRATSVQQMEDVLLRGHAPIPSASLIRTAVFQEVGGFSEDRAHHGAEDLHLWIRLLSRGKRFVSVDEFLGHYRSGGMSSRLDEHLGHVDRVLVDLHEEGLLAEQLFQSARERKHYEAARALHKEGQLDRAVHLYDRGQSGWKQMLLRSLALLGIRV